MKKIRLLVIVLIMCMVTGLAYGKTRSRSSNGFKKSSSSSWGSSSVKKTSTKSYSKPKSKPLKLSKAKMPKKKVKVKPKKKVKKVSTKSKKKVSKKKMTKADKKKSVSKLSKKDQQRARSKQRPKKKNRSEKVAKVNKKYSKSKTYNKNVTVINNNYNSRNEYYGYRTSFYGGYHNPYIGYGGYRSSYGLFDAMWLIYMLDNMHTNAQYRRYYHSNQSEMSEFRNSDLVRENAELRDQLAYADQSSTELTNQGIDPNEEYDVQGSEFALSEEVVDESFEDEPTIEKEHFMKSIMMGILYLVGAMIGALFGMKVWKLIKKEF